MTTVAITHGGPIELAAIHVATTTERLPQEMGRAFEAIYGSLGRRGIDPAGPPMAIYDRLEPPEVGLRIAVPVAHAIAADGQVVPERLPATDLATVEHVGPYEALGTTYTQLETWLDDHGYEATGPFRERYLNAPDEVTPDRLRTLIDRPVREPVRAASDHTSNGS
jgi:effector-binding domain-containing protein